MEKLCQRFRLTDDPRQWRDIAFCLSLLPFKSERSVKKLIDGLQFYRDKLHEETVYARFQEILTKARSNKSPNKPDAELNEFETVSGFWGPSAISDVLTWFHRYWTTTDGKVRKIRRSRREWRVRRRRLRSAPHDDVSE